MNLRGKIDYKIVIVVTWVSRREKKTDTAYNSDVRDRGGGWVGEVREGRPQRQAWIQVILQHVAPYLL
jgi:hypothetical protein